MSRELFSRTEMLLGEAAMDRLAESKVVVLGLGGVGGACAEGLVRSGVGELILVDNDKVSASNINRQIIASHSTIGLDKTEAARRRFSDINPDCCLVLHQRFVIAESLPEIIPLDADYVVDCIDTVTAKLDVAQYCQDHGIPLIASMGAGNKLDGSKLVFKDIYATQICPLARVMRRELRKRGVKALQVLYSEEPALEPFFTVGPEEGGKKRGTPGSVAFVPPVAGLLLSGFVIRQLVQK